jgi:hypothetical protein
MGYMPLVVAYISARGGADASRQRSLVGRWAARHRVRISKWFEESAPREGRVWKARPGLMEALAVMRGTEGTTLVLASRSPFDSVEEAIIEAVAKQQSGTVVAADGRAPSPRAIKLAEAFSAYEAAVRSTRARAERRRREAEGEPPFGEVPWGFRRSADGLKMLRDPKEHRVLAVVSHMRGNGFILREIVAELQRLNLRSRRGHRIGITRVHEMLRDIESEPRYEPYRKMLHKSAVGAN